MRYLRTGHFLKACVLCCAFQICSTNFGLLHAGNYTYPNKIKLFSRDAQSLYMYFWKADLIRYMIMNEKLFLKYARKIGTFRLHSHWKIFPKTLLVFFNYFAFLEAPVQPLVLKTFHECSHWGHLKVSGFTVAEHIRRLDLEKSMTSF